MKIIAVTLLICLLIRTFEIFKLKNIMTKLFALILHALWLIFLVAYLWGVE